MTITADQLVREARTRVANLSAGQVEARLFDPDTVLIDLREPEEIAEHGAIARAVHVPRGLLEFWADPASPQHLAELDPHRPTIVYCAAGSRSALAADVLTQLGYVDVGHLDGGIDAWKQAGLPVTGFRFWHQH